MRPQQQCELVIEHIQDKYITFPTLLLSKCNNDKKKLKFVFLISSFSFISLSFQWVFFFLVSVWNSLHFGTSDNFRNFDTHILCPFTTYFSTQQKEPLEKTVLQNILRILFLWSSFYHIFKNLQSLLCVTWDVVCDLGCSFHCN